MRLTETQKNFRKQMKKIDPVVSPYEYTERKSNFWNGISVIFGFILLVFLLVGFLSELNGGEKNTNIVNSDLNQNQREQRVVEQYITKQDSSNIRIVSNEDSSLLEELESTIKIVNKSIIGVSEQHRIPWASRDIEEYRRSLIEGILIIDKEKDKLFYINSIGDFNPLYILVMEYLSNQRMAYQYYLDYLNGNRPSNIEVGNKYNSLAAENIRNYIPLFTEILQENGYKYTILDDGSVRYYLTKN